MNSEPSSRLRRLLDKIAIPRDQVVAVLPVAVALILGYLIESAFKERSISFVSLPFLNAWFWLQVPRPKTAKWLYAVAALLLWPISQVPIVIGSFYFPDKFIFSVVPFCVSLTMAILFRLVLRLRICDLQMRLPDSHLTSARPSIFDYLALTFAIAMLSFAIRKSSGNSWDFRAMKEFMVSMVVLSTWLLVTLLVQLKLARAGRTLLSVSWMLLLSVPLALLLSLMAFVTTLATRVILPHQLALPSWDVYDVISGWKESLITCMLLSAQVGAGALLLRWCGLCTLPRTVGANEGLPADSIATNRISDRTTSRIIYFSLSTVFCLLWISAAISKHAFPKQSPPFYYRGWPYPFEYAFDDITGFETTWFAWPFILLDVAVFFAVVVLQFLLIPLIARRFGAQSRRQTEDLRPLTGPSSNALASMKTPGTIAVPFSFVWLRRLAYVTCLLVTWSSPLWLATLPNIPQLWERDLLLETEHVIISIDHMPERPLFHTITSLTPSVVTQVEVPDYQLVASDPTLRDAVLRIFRSPHLRSANLGGLDRYEQDIAKLLQNPGLHKLELHSWNPKLSSLSSSMNLPSLASIRLFDPTGDEAIRLDGCERLEEAYLEITKTSGPLNLQVGRNPCEINITNSDEASLIGDKAPQAITLRGNIPSCFIHSDRPHKITIASTCADLWLLLDNLHGLSEARSSLDLTVSQRHDDLRIQAYQVNFENLSLPLGAADLHLEVQDGSISSPVIAAIPVDAVSQLIADGIDFDPEVIKLFQNWKNLAFLELNPRGISADALIEALPVGIEMLDLKRLQFNSEQIHRLYTQLPNLAILQANVDKAIEIDFDQLSSIKGLSLEQCEQVKFKGSPKVNRAATFVIGKRPRMFEKDAAPFQMLMSICDSDILLDQFDAIASGCNFAGEQSYYLGATGFGPADYKQLRFPRAKCIWLNWKDVASEHLSEMIFEGEDLAVTLVLQGFEGSAQTILEAVEQNPTSNCVGIVAIVGENCWNLDASWFQRVTHQMLEWKFCGITLGDQFVTALDRLTEPVVIHLEDCNVPPELWKAMLEHDSVRMVSISNPESLSSEIQSLIQNHLKVFDADVLPMNGLLIFE